MNGQAQLRWSDGVLTTMSGRVMAQTITLDDACSCFPDVVVRVRIESRP